MPFTATSAPAEHGSVHGEDRPTGSHMVAGFGPASQSWLKAQAAWNRQLAADRAARDSFVAWRELHACLTREPAGEDVFVRHTYLAVVARRIAAQLVGETARSSSRKPDLFAWPQGGGPVESIDRELGRLDMSRVDADVLKPLHHALTSCDSRRPLGETYTPDWLAAWMVESLPGGCARSILDPACGSGTFLFFAVRHLIKQHAIPEDSLPAGITIHGFDANPLAVELATTNYLLALAPRLNRQGPPIEVPVLERDTLADGAMGVYDVIIGNPPWLPLRALPPSRQRLMKRLAETYGLAERRGEMATHLETATLFLTHCADRALAADGRIDLVLPRTIFTAEQYDRLRRGRTTLPRSSGYRLAVEHVLDCEGVSPLFRTPAAVLTCRKSRDEPGPSFPVTRLRGRLPSADVSLAEARRLLVRSESTIGLRVAGGRSWWATDSDASPAGPASPYKSAFRQGATLVPRSLWFVEVGVHREGTVRLTSAAPSKAGPVADYAGVSLSGDVEPQFLFETVLGDDLLPFAPRRLRYVVLPAAERDGRLVVLGGAALRERGWHGMAAWMSEAERIWNERHETRTTTMSMAQRLDHVHGLSAQNLAARWKVIYPNFQRYGIACVVDSHARAGAVPCRFVADTATYVFETEDESEAHYLGAMLNSRAVDERLQPLRGRVQAAHPNVHKKIFDVAPIPRYDASDRDHARLAEWAAAARASIIEALAAGEASLFSGIAAARRAAREMVAPQLAQIDAVAAELFSLSPRTKI